MVGKSPPFEISLVMAGAVSAGAYTSRVSASQTLLTWLTDTSLKSTIGSAQRTYLDSTDSVTEDLCQSISPIDTKVLGFIQNAKKFKSTTLGRRVGLTFWLLCGGNL